MRRDSFGETTEAEILAWVRLARSRNVGPATFRRLIDGYGGPAAALEALPTLAGRGGARRYEVCGEDQAGREIEAAAAAGARMLRLGRPDYPAALAEISDPPPYLWALGDAGMLAKGAVALVGARNASALGLRLARKLARDLGEAGYVVVSGLARGIDAAAHEAALETGTAAVMAGGVDHVYPAENAALAEKIAAEGVRVSEAPMGLEPQSRHFPRRNRIIAGLARAVILIEAAERSGSLITARFALEQGREVMAAPGSPLDPRSGGCNALIRQGAALVRSAGDVLEALEAPRRLALHEPAPIRFERSGPADAAVTNSLRAEVERLLGHAPVEEDEIARLTGAPPGALAQALLELELAGRLDRRAGGLVALAPH